MNIAGQFLKKICILSGFLAVCISSFAQSNLLVGVYVSSTNLEVNSILTYSISLTNASSVQIQDIYVTNALPDTTQILGTTNVTNPGTVVTNGSTVTFRIFQLTSGQTAQMGLVVKPTVSGSHTNTVTTATALLQSNIVIQVVSQVTNIPPKLADLGVGVTGPMYGALVGDVVTFGVTVTNFGPSTATNVVLTNLFTGAFKYISVSPTNQSYTNIAVGPLTNGAFRTFKITVQPTNSGSLAFFSSVGAMDIVDTNSVNNTASNNITVQALTSGILVVTNISAMTFNPQISLMQQSIQVLNVSTNITADSAHVIVTGLTNWLRNAVGTNALGPFVVYGGQLAPGQSVTLLMEYVIPSRTAINLNTNYLAYAGAGVDVTASGVGVEVARWLRLDDGSFLIEFEAITNRYYTVLYGDSFALTNAAQPSFKALANRVQWIDNGPPKTISHPTNTSSRFYRVLLNP